MSHSILFMGTPDLAAVCLRRLVAGGLCDGQRRWMVTGVISQPDKPRGRNLQFQPTAVKAAALELGIECYQPAKARDAVALEWIVARKPDLIVVAAYGQILPQALLDIPRYGCINVHTSLLPRYRGAAPIQWAILDGCAETGVTLMKMNAGLDTGDIISVRRTPISIEDNAETLHDRLAELGGELLVETLPDYISGKIIPTPQPQEDSTYARKISKEDGHLDWSLPAQTLDCRIRGLTPWPGAFTFIHEGSRTILLKIWKAVPSDNTTSSPPGSVLKSGAGELEIACGGGTLRILSLQREGKKRLNTSEFLVGTSLAAGTILD